MALSGVLAVAGEPSSFLTIRFQYVFQVGLELMILPLQLHKCWNYRHAPLYPANPVFLITTTKSSSYKLSSMDEIIETKRWQRFPLEFYWQKILKLY
jgi:hypothetical protein